MSLDFTKDVLFVGHGCSAPAWYRVVLPAMTLGADYVGVVGEPPDTHYATGIVQGRSAMPMFSDYRVVVLQQAYGKGWLDIIKALQRRGIAVVYECDDWLHAIKHQADHDFREDFGNAALSEFEMCMKACDAMIVSTDFLASVYRSFNRNVFVCENGVDVARYDIKMPERPWHVPPGVIEVPLYGGAGRRADGTFTEATEEVGSAFVDAEDADRVLGHRWLQHPGGYAYRAVGRERKSIYLHRFLLGLMASEDGHVDHRNGDKHDNRRANLDVVDDAENRLRRMRQPKPGRGVRPNKNGKWSAYVDTPTGRAWLGHGHSSKEAATAVVEDFRAEHLPPLVAPEPLQRKVAIGWAGATGHRLALVPWLQAVAKVMRANQNTVFVSIGQDYATAFLEQFPQRAIAVPFCAIEQYPAAMTMMDIAIAPAAPTGFYRGKSDLRWLEAGALGIPTVAHPLVYPKLKHGQDGFHASTPAEVKTFVDRLVRDPNLRLVLGENARSYVRRERSAEAVAERWREVIEKISSERRKGSPGQGLRYAHG